MAQLLHFSVEGEYITNRARELFYQEHKLDKAINIIKGATTNDSLSETEHLCLLYTSDAADDLIGVVLGGRRMI